MVVRIGVKLSPKNIREKVTQLETRSARVTDTFLHEMLQSSIRSMKNSIKRKTTTRTGTLVNSVGATMIENSRGGFDRRANIRIIVDAPYASFVDRGTQPQHGFRFIPMPNSLGRNFRMRSGVEGEFIRGIQARKFTEDAAKNIRKHFSQFTRRAWVSPMAQQFKRFR